MAEDERTGKYLQRVLERPVRLLTHGLVINQLRLVNQLTLMGFYVSNTKRNMNHRHLPAFGFQVTLLVIEKHMRF